MVKYDCLRDGYYSSYICRSCNNTYRTLNHCNKRTCPTCNKKRSRRLNAKYHNIDQYLENPYFATFTIKNVTDVIKGVKKIRDCFNKLIRRKPYNRWFAGGLYAIEVQVRFNNNYNIHIHACIDSAVNIKRGFWGYANIDPSLNIHGIKSDWFDLTKDSFIIQWDKTRYPKQAVSYCLKYASKPGYYKGKEDFIEASLKNSRMLSFFGVLYDIKGTPKPQFCCPVCFTVGSFEFLCTVCENHVKKDFYYIEDWAG